MELTDKETTASRLQFQSPWPHQDDNHTVFISPGYCYVLQGLMHAV